MADGLRLWGRRALFLAACAALALAGLLPLGGAAPPRVPAPDMLLLLTLAWVQRRPREAPALSVAAVSVLADLVLQRPPGLHAALATIAAERLRARPGPRGEAGQSQGGFGAEWARAALAVLAIAAAQRLVLAVLLVPQPPAGPVLLHALVTVAAYPLAALGAALLGARRRPAERARQERAA